MRGRRGLERGRTIPLLMAGTVGYLIGVWHPAILRSNNISAAQMVALRFPQIWRDAQPVEATADAPNATPHVTAMDETQLALFSPEPMVAQKAKSQSATPQAIVQVASAEDVAPLSDAAPLPRPMPVAARRVVEPKPLHPVVAAKPNVSTTPHRAERPGFMLDDSQIASIKSRLHLTPDQEEMWPAVEAALRNIAYTNAREAHRRGAPATAMQAAAVDPNSAEVQGLKSAALPLIMSFNAEQKDEVRNLAHVMGLDQLASQF
jgi:LTXXQ motif family protein